MRTSSSSIRRPEAAPYTSELTFTSTLPGSCQFLEFPDYPSPDLEGGEAGGGDSDSRLEEMKSQSGNLWRRAFKGD